MTMTSGIDITDILRLAADKGASDIILAAGLPPQFKLSGDYDAQGFEPLSASDTRKLMYSMMNERQQRIFEEKRELDFSFALGDKARFRVNAFMQRGNVGGVMRLIPTTVRTIAEMGLPQTVIDIANAPRGLVLVTGPTGSGKSTTLASHTNSAPESIDRIVDVFPEEQQEQIRVQLANNLVAVMTQQLLPRADGQGRVLAYEILLANPAVRALIREGKTFQITSVMQTGAREGMVTMDAYLAGLFRRHLITYDKGLERAIDPKEFARLANDASAGLGGASMTPAAPPVPAYNSASSSSTGRGGDFGRGAAAPATPAAPAAGRSEPGRAGGFGRR